MDTFTAALAEVVNTRRQTLKISSEDLSTTSGVPYTTLYRFLHGKGDLTTARLKLVAQALDTTLEALAAEAERSAA